MQREIAVKVETTADILMLRPLNLLLRGLLEQHPAFSDAEEWIDNLELASTRLLPTATITRTAVWSLDRLRLSCVSMPSIWRSGSRTEDLDLIRTRYVPRISTSPASEVWGCG